MIETPDMQTNTTQSVTEAGWEPPAAPLEMPRQVLEAEPRSSEWSLLRLFWKRSRA